jgi:hypothetical protein
MRCPASALLDTWAGHGWNGGVQLESLPELELLSVETRNSVYEIAVVSSPTGEVLVRGGKYFPEFVPARLAGSSLGGSFLKVRGIYVGFNLELELGQGSIVTSPVRSITRIPAAAC